MKTYTHECLACNGEGTVEEIDHERTRSYSEQPEWKTSVCDVCHGDGEVTLDETAHAFVCAMVDDTRPGASRTRRSWPSSGSS